MPPARGVSLSDQEYYTILNGFSQYFCQKISVRRREKNAAGRGGRFLPLRRQCPLVLCPGK